MTKVRLKLPSLKSTSKDIAEDLKAIREALNAKPANAEHKAPCFPKQKTKNPHQKKQQNGFFNSSAEAEASSKNENTMFSPSCSLDVQGPNINSSNRPVRQRKPNQRYTDLFSEKQAASRKRTISTVSQEDTEENCMYETKTGSSVERKKSKTGSSPKKKKSSKQRRSFAEYDEHCSDQEMVTRKLSHSKKSRSPSNKKRPVDCRQVDLNMEPLTPPPGQTVGGFEAPPEFDDEEEADMSSHRVQATNQFGSNVGSTASVRFADAMENNSFHGQRASQITSTLSAGDSKPSGITPSMAPVTHNVSSAVALSSPFSSLNDFANAAGQYEAQSENNPAAYDERGGNADYTDEGPMLVYGPGPRTLTYNGEYYPLAPIVFKRRPGKFPRPRSARYKPSSPNYKPPDVSRFRERFKKMQAAVRRGRGRRGGGSSSTSTFFRRAALSSTSTFFPSMGVGDSRWGYEHLLQMDETKDAVEALRPSAFGSMDVGSGTYGNDGLKTSAYDDFYDADYLSTNDISSTQRSRGGRRRSVTSSIMAEDAAARGVYADLAPSAEENTSMHSSLLDSYRFGYSKPLQPPLSLLSASATITSSGIEDPVKRSGTGSKFCFIPPEIAGDHCYIKPKGGNSVVTVDVELPSSGGSPAIVDPSVAGISIKDGGVDSSSTVVVLDDGTVIDESFTYGGSVDGQPTSAYYTVSDQAASAPANFAEKTTVFVGQSRVRSTNVMMRRHGLEQGVYDEEDEDEYGDAPPRMFRASSRY